MSNEQGQPQTESTEIKALEVFFPDELKKGSYSNNVFINHTPEEVVLDFLNVIAPVGSVVARIVLSPSHAKRLANALRDNLEKYEEIFGEIPLEIKPLEK